VVLDELNLPSQKYQLDQVITLGGEASRTEDIRLKQATVFHLVKRAMKEDRYFDGDQLNDSIKFIHSNRESGSYLAEVWGSEFESRKPIHIKGLVTDARVEYGQIELLDIMVEKPGKRKPKEKIYTVGSAELPYIWLLQQAVDRVKPDIVARKLHLRPTYEKETPQYTNIVEAKNLTVRYGRNMVFERLSFTMKEGEILGIIGESGAGKTTLIKTLLREIKPQKGTAIIAGVDTSEMGEIKPQIGFVPQELSHMYDTFTPLENIITFGKQYGIPESKLIERGKQLLRDFGMFEKTNTPIRDLSGGQKRRASVAIALAHFPKLLILDEPTSGLDPDRRYEFWKYLDLINREYGTSLIVISHYPEETEFCDKAAVFIKGEGLFAYAEPKELKKSLPGKGYSVGIVLEEVRPEAATLIENLENVRYVLQRGELIKIFSDQPLNDMAIQAANVLDGQNIPIRTIIPRLEVDMTDYFISVARRLLIED
jgi:ABC-2 type transport system ATP-binding protein